MKTLCLLLIALLGWVARAETTKLMISVSDPSGRQLVANAVFDGDRVLEFGPEISAAPLAVFDLSSPAWTETETGKRITLDQARAWASNSKAGAESSLARVTDPDQRAFVQSLLTPEFVVSKSGDGVTLKSRFLNYTASAPLTLNGDLKKRLLVYDTLHAYRKAMAPRQLPPFTQLEVCRLLADNEIYPGQLVMELTTPNGTVRVSTSYEVSSLTEEELTRLTSLKALQP